jgi:hypothetical protein
MPVTIVKLRVGDYQTWKNEFDQLEQLRREHGWVAHTICRDASDPAVVVIVNRVHDLNRARSYLGSDPVRQGVQRAGIQGPPEVWYLSDAGDLQY